MQTSKGMVTGFVAGIVVAGGAVLLLRDDVTPRPDESAQVAELGAKIERLEHSVSQLSLQAAGSSRGVAADGGTSSAATAPATDAKKEQTRLAEQQRVVASAEARVEQAIQTGQWTLEQARDLDRLTVDLPAEERGRIHARIAAAINNDQIKPELP